MDRPAGVRAVAHERAVSNRRRAAVGIQRPAPVDGGIRSECTVENGEGAGKRIRDRAAAKVGKVIGELALANLSYTFYAHKDRAAGFIGLVKRCGAVVLEGNAGDGCKQVDQHRAARAGEAIFDRQVRQGQ